MPTQRHGALYDASGTLVDAGLFYPPMLYVNVLDYKVDATNYVTGAASQDATAGIEAALTALATLSPSLPNADAGGPGGGVVIFPRGVNGVYKITKPLKLFGGQWLMGLPGENGAEILFDNNSNTYDGSGVIEMHGVASASPGSNYCTRAGVRGLRIKVKRDGSNAFTNPDVYGIRAVVPTTVPDGHTLFFLINCQFTDLQIDAPRTQVWLSHERVIGNKTVRAYCQSCLVSRVRYVGATPPQSGLLQLFGNLNEVHAVVGYGSASSGFNLGFTTPSGLGQPAAGGMVDVLGSGNVVRNCDVEANTQAPGYYAEGANLSFLYNWLESAARSSDGVSYHFKNVNGGYVDRLQYGSNGSFPAFGYQVTFQGGLGGQDLALMTANASALTAMFPHDLPRVTVVQTTAGAPPSTNEVQTVTVSRSTTGGTFTLTYNGATTAPLAFNATAAEVQTALNALSSITSPGGSVSVAIAVYPGASPPYFSRTKLENCTNLRIDRLVYNEVAVTVGLKLADVLDASADCSNVSIGTVSSFYDGDNTDPAPGVTVDRTTSVALRYTVERPRLPQTGNLLRNGDFANGLYDWTTVNNAANFTMTPSVEDEPAAASGKRLRLTTTYTGASGVFSAGILRTTLRIPPHLLPVTTAGVNQVGQTAFLTFLFDEAAYSLNVTATGGTYTLTVTNPDGSTQTTAAIPYNATASTYALTVGAGSTGGTFTLTVTDPGGTPATTAPIAYNASAATVRSELEKLGNVGPLNVSVTQSGGPLPGTAVTYTINLHRGNQVLAIGTSSVTGGTLTLPLTIVAALNTLPGVSATVTPTPTGAGGPYPYLIGFANTRQTVQVNTGGLTGGSATMAGGFGGYGGIHSPQFELVGRVGQRVIGRLKPGQVLSASTTLEIHFNYTNLISGSAAGQATVFLSDFSVVMGPRFDLPPDAQAIRRWDTGNVQLYGKSAELPGVGTWQKGDIIWNAEAVSGQPVGWVCTTTGTPTWKSIATVPT